MALQGRKPKFLLKGELVMKTWKIRIRFTDGAHIERCEWGRTAKQAIATLRSIYGNSFTVVSIA